MGLRARAGGQGDDLPRLRAVRPPKYESPSAIQHLVVELDALRDPPGPRIEGHSWRVGTYERRGPTWEAVRISARGSASRMRRRL